VKEKKEGRGKGKDVMRLTQAACSTKLPLAHYGEKKRKGIIHRCRTNYGGKKRTRDVQVAPIDPPCVPAPERDGARKKKEKKRGVFWNG